MLLRGENRWKAELLNIFIVDSINEGIKENVPMLCLRFGQGKIKSSILLLLSDKTNQDGRAQYGVVFHNKNIQYCPVDAVAFIFYPSYGPIFPIVWNGIPLNYFPSSMTLTSHCRLVHIKRFVITRSLKYNVFI